MQEHLLIVGLGNPGEKYALTRHNIGFMILDRFVYAHHLTWDNDTRSQALYARLNHTKTSVFFLKPQTFMNLSGEAVRDLSKFFGLDSEHILVIYDDISLKPGKIRIRPSGSDGGHNGIKSIIYCLGTNVFPRIKIGVGSPDKEAGEDLADYVLDTMDKESFESILKTPEIVAEILTNGIDIARQKFN